jgi:hypothetical protein
MQTRFFWLTEIVNSFPDSDISSWAPPRRCYLIFAKPYCVVRYHISNTVGKRLVVRILNTSPTL